MHVFFVILLRYNLAKYYRNRFTIKKLHSKQEGVNFIETQPHVSVRLSIANK